MRGSGDGITVYRTLCAPGVLVGWAGALLAGGFWGLNIEGVKCDVRRLDNDERRFCFAYTCCRCVL